MATDVAGEEFVTIVPVGEGRPSVKDPSFVTVLTVSAAAGAAEVVVRRPRGERLGLGLKFEGGSAAAEKVRRLLVQSCADDSPAANACAPWGHLIPGDEILAIDGVSVSELTRIDCVRRLKDSDESLTLLVRHFESDNTEQSKKMAESVVTCDSAAPKQEILRPTMLPPPVPPRKLGKKNSFKDKTSLQTVGEQINNETSQQNDLESLINGKHNGTFTKLSRKSSFDSHLLRQNKESIAYLKKGSPEEVRRLVRRLSDGKAMPPEAEVYIDLLSSEWERCLVLADAESDDTGSSISTVVDRLGSMASSVENSIPSTPIMQQKTIDIQKVLNCIENIDTDILRDMTTKRSLHRQVESKAADKTTNTITNGSSLNSNSFTSFTTEEIVQSKKLVQNDKNNNSTVTNNKINNFISNEKINKSSDKLEDTIEKPKPMPRNTRVERSASERKPRPIPIPETPPPPVPESLLTPTKKNCIETWLQRSEAEMNNKTIEKLEDGSMPEVLPRLIDFVPKPQFKESVHEAPLTRPTAPPPPPPAETREDGSGASLDTIGEMDESSDVTDNAKPVTTTKTKERKSSFERSFWEDRINKSDTEDKSLSNDETPLPSCPRQPPDGVETPSDVVEKVPDPPSRLPPLHFLRPRYSYTSRTQDARSEASVKDKIAMFSSDHAVSTDRIDKCGTLPTRNAVSTRKSTAVYNYTEASTLDRRLTKSQDNLDELPRFCKKPIESRPEASGGFSNTVSSNYGTTKMNRPLHSENKPLFYGSTTVLPSSVESTLSQPAIYHMRSTSDDSGSKNISKHRSNLEHLIEQRKKSMSKLRGLVIPEIQGPVVGLPEIKVQDNISKSFLLKSNSDISNNKTNTKPNHVKPVILSETKWKTNFSNNIPKYSPAFKRKSLQVYTPTSMSKESTPERSFSERIETLNKMNHKSILNKNSKNIDLNDTPRQLSTSILPSKGYLANTYMTKKEFNNNLSHARDYKNLDIKICTVTDIVDSDNDSAMSSTQSSYRSSASSPMHTLDTIESDSSRLSPRISNYTYSIVKSDITPKSPTEKSYEEYIKRSVCRSMSSDTNVSLSSSAGSAATSGSQASCSSLESSVADSDKKKVSKSSNVDTLNRKNILASAKCRSGRDANLTSPVIETKFPHESCDRSPSPVLKASERLSTLTPLVSAVSNKGENRRRNKIIAESDSDSDSDVNIRQRKADFKNSRLKRNSSSANKSKQNENSSESPKAEDAPRVISEKIIKEIKKAGLENFTSSKGPAVLEKHGFEVIKTDNTSLNKEEKVYKNNITTKTIESKICDIKYKEMPQVKLTPKNSVIDSKIDVRNDVMNGSIIKDAKISTRTIRLKRGAGTGVGVILAGGIDCEAKDVTVHRVLADSVAARAGLKRGVKVCSINGCAMAGLTHAQSVTILKEQRSEVVIEIENESTENASANKGGSEKAESKARHDVGDAAVGSEAGSVVTVLLEKAGGGAGLGFGLDGGRDSPRGDCPLTIKKLFAGGSAAQSGQVLVGAELLSAGGQSMEGFTRTQAWAALKSLPAGPVTLVLRNPKEP